MTKLNLYNQNLAKNEWEKISSLRRKKIQSKNAQKTKKKKLIE